jgi:hypothetical protein
MKPISVPPTMTAPESVEKSIADNYFAFPEYAEALDDLDPKLSQGIRPLVDLAQVAAFIAKNIHRSPDSVISIVQNAPPPLKALLSDERRIQALDEPLATHLRWIDPLRLKQFGALIAGALDRSDAAERQRDADDAHARRLLKSPEADPNHQLRLADEAQQVADFIAANRGLFHWKIADNLAQATQQLAEILSDANRMELLDPLVADRLDGLPTIQVSEIQAVIANALKRIDAPDRTAVAASARAAAGLEPRTFDPWFDVEKVVEFATANYRLAPEVIFQNLAIASKELRTIFADRAHLASIEKHIDQQLPQLAAPDLAKFHEVVALAFGRGDAPERVVVADVARNAEANPAEANQVADTRLADVAEVGPPNELAPEGSGFDGDPEHELALQQMNEIARVVLPNIRKSDGELVEALNKAPSLVRSILGNQARMGELAALLEKQSSGIDPVDLRRVQALLAREGSLTPEPLQSGHLDASEPAPPTEADNQPAPPIPRGANGFRPAEPPASVRPTPVSAASILERITYKTQSDGSVLYSLDGRPAFVDHGDQILMSGDADQDEQAIVAALLVAKEKYGGAFELTGDMEFKRRTIEIMIKYKIDAMLKSPEQDALRRELLKSKIEPATPASPDQPVAPIDVTRIVLPIGSLPLPARPAGGPIMMSEPKPPAEPVNRLAGLVLRHGEAPFEHDPRNKLSYFVELENADGKSKTIWGIDLARAARAQGLKIGDSVVLQNLGQKPVNVTQHIKDKDGKVIGSESIVSHRNKWEIELVKRAVKAEDHHEKEAATTPDDVPQSFVHARAWWANQHTIIEHFQTDYSDMQTDLDRIGPKPAADQVYWFDAGHPGEASPNSTQIVSMTPQPAQDDSDPAAPMLVLHAIKTLQDGRSIPSLLLFQGASDQYLQGFIHTGEQKQAVIAHIPSMGAPGTDRTIYLSAMTPTPDGPRWQAIGHGNAINRSDDGKPVFFDEVNFVIGESELVARVNKRLDHPSRQKLGFEKPQRERPKDASLAAPAAGKPAADPGKGPRISPQVRKPNRPRSASQSR